MTDTELMTDFEEEIPDEMVVSWQRKMESLVSGRKHFDNDDDYSLWLSNKLFEMDPSETRIILIAALVRLLSIRTALNI